MSLQDMFKESHSDTTGTNNSLTFSEEAYGFGGLLVTSLFQILDQCDLTNYANGVQIYLYLSLLSRSFSDHHLRCGGWLNLEFSKREKHSGSGEMKSRQLRMTRSVLIIAHALINIVDEFHRQGVRHIVFCSLLFP